MSRLPEPWPSLLERIAKIEAWIRRQSASSPFFGTGMHPNGQGGLDHDNYVPGESGYRLAETPEFNSLILRNGIIGDNALASLLKAEDVSFSRTNFAVTAGSYVLLGSVDRTVPAGFTQAIVNASAWMFARNNNTTGGVDGTGTDAIFCFVRVSGTDGDTNSSPKGQGISGFGGFTTATSGVGKVKAGLTPGSTVTFSVWAASSVQTLAADAQNSVDLAGTIIWIR